MTNPRDQALDFLSRLGSNPATAFRENGVADTVKAILSEIGLSYEQDSFGNIIAKVSGTDPTANPLAIVAHMDHPGYEVVGQDGECGAREREIASQHVMTGLRDGRWLEQRDASVVRGRRRKGPCEHQNQERFLHEILPEIGRKPAVATFDPYRRAGHARRTKKRCRGRRLLSAPTDAAW